jgi:hypothetical protein
MVERPNAPAQTVSGQGRARIVASATSSAPPTSYCMRTLINGALMMKYLLATAFVLITSLAVYGATIAPAAVAFDGYDHSYETIRADQSGGTVEAGY